MIPSEFIESAQVPESTEELSLYGRGEEYSIRVDRQELMNSRVYGMSSPLPQEKRPAPARSDNRAA